MGAGPHRTANYNDITYSTIGLRIGLGTTGGTFEEPLDGYIDEVRIFDRALSDSEIKAMVAENMEQISQPDVDRLRGYVVQWLLDNCADNRPGEEANFRHYQLAGFSDYDVKNTGHASWTFTSGIETWNIMESPTLYVDNPHGNSWCLK